MFFKVRIPLVALIAGTLVAVSAPAAAQASAGIKSFFAANCKISTCTAADVEAEGFTQAGAHPNYGITAFEVNTSGTRPTAVPEEVVTHVRTDVAPGLATNPQAVPECTIEELGKEYQPGGFHTGLYEEPECEGQNELGYNEATVYVEGLGDLEATGIAYNLVPPKGLASDYGVALPLPEGLTTALLKFAPGIPLFAHTFIEGGVEWGAEAEGIGKADYHDYFEINVSPLLPLISSRLVFKGRAGEGDFITNPTSCTGTGPQTTTTLKLKFESGESAKAEYSGPLGASGCNLLPFEPGFSLTQGKKESEAPDPLTAEFTLPHHIAAGEIDSSQVKTATVTLPEGITINPSAAAGIEACTPKEIGIGTTHAMECPEGSRLGTVALNVPGLPAGSLQGYVFLGGPESGPITGPPYVIYVDAESERYGVDVRLRGVTTPSETTGQLTTTFTENPEQPFSSLVLHFNGGPLAPLANSLKCESSTATTSFTPFAGGSAFAPTTPFEVTGCPATLPFEIGQSTTWEATRAGGRTAYTYSLTRAAGQEYIEKVKTTLPEGLAGAIPDVTLCEEPQAANGTCAAASRIGTATVTAGAGSSPYTFSGPVYMTGPYNGAPFGLSIAVPAVAGPFNLGTVVTRATINVNPYTSRVTAESVLPTIWKGIPLRLRSINVEVNRQGFLYNPTSCEKRATETTLTSSFGAVQGGLSSPFQLEGCNSLGFKPTFTASTSGRPTKADGTSLTTTITQGAGQANIKSVLVTLPYDLPSRLSTLNKACLAATFEANPSACPAESRVGTAIALTPLLPGAMTGTAYYISHGGAQFPDLDIVLEDVGVRTILVGKTKITKGITTTNFATSPDVPVSNFTLSLPAGPYSALGAYGNVCRAKLLMPTVITGQNGKVLKLNTVIKPVNCPVQVLRHKVSGKTAYLTIKTFEAGRISAGGSGVATVYKTLSAANGGVSVKVPLSRSGLRRRPFNVRLRVGFKPNNKRAHSTQSFVTVHFG